MPEGCPDLSKIACVEYLGKGNEHWPCDDIDLIAGYLHKDDPDNQQFCMFWVLDKGPKAKDELHFYIFRHASRISSGIGQDLFGRGGMGQENGGGSGNGPIKH